MAEELRIETIEGDTLALLKMLMADKELEAFNLVGGTALALQLGHRKSIDLDLFTLQEFDSGRLAEHLKERYDAEIANRTTYGVFGFIEKVKFDMLMDQTPLIDKLENREGIRMLSMRDIGAMKLSAIYGNGGRLKDFADMYTLLEKYPLTTYLEYAQRKYPEVPSDLLKQSLLYHVDIDLKQKVDYIGKTVEWPLIVDRLREAFHNPFKEFVGCIQLRQNQRIKNEPPAKRASSWIDFRH